MKKLVFLIILALCVSCVYGDTIVKKSAKGSTKSGQSYSNKMNKGSRNFPDIMNKGSQNFPERMNRGSFPQGFSSDGFPGMISSDSNIVKELGLNTTQKKKLDSLNKSYKSKMNSSKSGNSFDVLRRQMENYNSDFKKLLTNTQKSKYENMNRGGFGGMNGGFPGMMGGSGSSSFPNMFGGSGMNGGFPGMIGGSGMNGGFPGMISSDSNIAKELGLTSAQKKKLDTLNKQMTSKRSNNGGAFYRPGLRGMSKVDRDKEIANLRKEAEEYERSFESILNQSQRNKYNNMRSGSGSFPNMFGGSGMNGGFPNMMGGNGFPGMFNNMLGDLNLSKDQQKKLEELNKKYNSKMNTGDRQKTFSEYEKAFRDILNKSQKEKLDNMKKQGPKGFGGKDFPQRKSSDSGNKSYPRGII